MILTLDAQTEQRIQRELDRGHYRDPAEVIAHALNLLEDQEEWLQRNRQAIEAHLEQGMRDVEQGNTYSPEDARQILAERRAARAR